MKFGCEWTIHLYFINEVYAAEIRKIFEPLVDNIVFMLFKGSLI